MGAHVNAGRNDFIVCGRHGQGVTSVADVKRRHESRLMKMRGVIGVGIGQRDGKECIRIYVKEESPRILAALPQSLEEVPVEVVVTGTFKAL